MIRVNVELDTNDFIESLITEKEYDYIIEFIMELDQRIADVDFTEELIAKLIKSMKKDETLYEYYEGDFLKTFLKRYFPDWSVK
jgi:hypothetical protein